MEKEKK